MAVEGQARIKIGENTEVLKKGQSLLIPACAKKIQLEADHAELLEVYIQ